MVKRLALLASLFGSQLAYAQAEVPVPYQSVEYKRLSSIGQWTPLTGTTPGGGGVVFRGPAPSDATPKIVENMRLTQDGRAVNAGGTSKVPLGATGKTIPVQAVAKITAGSLLVGLATKLNHPAVGLGLVIGAPILMDWLASGKVGINPDPSDYPQRPFLRTADTNDLQFAVPHGSETVWFNSRNGACSWHGQKVVSAYAASGYWQNVSLVSANVVGSSCRWMVTAYTPQGQKNSLDGSPAISSRTMTGGIQLPASLDDILPYMDAPEAPALTPQIVQDAIKGAGVDPFGAQGPEVKVSGPASIPGEKTTTSTKTRVQEGTTTESTAGTGTQPATKTTTQSTNHNVTYNDNKVTYNTKTTTTTNITNNITNQTTTINESEQVKEGEDPKEETPDLCEKNHDSILCEKVQFSDTNLPAIPKLYDRKYPDGLTGVWNSKIAEIKQTSLFTLAEQLMPVGMNAGTCPSFSINLTFATWADYGTGDVSPPCWVWDFAKVVIVISALLLARSLIFGG